MVDGGFIGRAFASLQGKLKLPVRGELAGRFGAQREDGGVTWKGLFIRAADGQAVRSVADGRVVYADWLRGYGNLVIVFLKMRYVLPLILLINKIIVLIHSLIVLIQLVHLV